MKEMDNVLIKQSITFQSSSHFKVWSFKQQNKMSDDYKSNGLTVNQELNEVRIVLNTQV